MLEDFTKREKVAIHGIQLNSERIIELEKSEAVIFLANLGIGGRIIWILFRLCPLITIRAGNKTF